jgi:hypothetical protein
LEGSLEILTVYETEVLSVQSQTPRNFSRGSSSTGSSSGIQAGIIKRVARTSVKKINVVLNFILFFYL